MDRDGGDTMSDRELRTTFDSDARRYDRARPTYPPALFDDLVALSEIPPNGRVLEVGPGTGQATLAMAERGYRIVAVELGANLAHVARDNLKRFEQVKVHTSAFEQWPLPREPFDVVLAATALHWIDPDVRYRKPAAALRQSGALAVITTDHVAGEDEDFWVTVQDCYERHMPGTEPGLRLPAADDVHDDSESIESTASGLFDAPILRRYFWDAPYTTGEYLDVLRTYSNHIALDPEQRDSLLACIARLIDDRFGGHIRKRYLFRLAVARRR
jgi:SAM-dependent methyltransferase